MPKHAWLPLVHGLVALELALALFAFRDVPLVDLPQHAAQIATWMRLDAEPSPHPELELNFRTPYLVAYPLARLLAPALGAVAALKFVIFVAVCLQALGLHTLVTRLGHDPFLGLLAWPIGLGYAFCFGFVSYIAAVPALYFAIERAVVHARNPRGGSFAALAALLCLCLLAHGIMFALALFAVLPLLFGGRGSLFVRLGPLLVPFALGALWILPGTSTERIGGDYWGLSLVRLIELPALLVGIGATDGWSSVFGVLLLTLVGLSLGRPEPAALRFAPLAVTLGGYLLFPTLFRGVGPLSPRFVTLLVPALLIAFTPRTLPGPRQSVTRGGLAGLAIGVVALWNARLGEFNRETTSFHELVRPLPPGLRVRPLVFERASAAFPGIPALLHFPAYYLVEKGGTQGYSFAMYPLSVVRYREGVEPLMPGGLEWQPEAFDALREAGHYDYFLVHSHLDRGHALFGSAGSAIELDRRRGSWWGYRRRMSAP